MLKVLKMTLKNRLWGAEKRGYGEGWRTFLSEEQSTYYRQLECVLEAMIFQLGRLHRLEELWLGRTIGHVGAGLRVANMTDKQKETSQAQASRMLHVLPTLRGLSRMEFRGLKDVIYAHKLEIVQQWKGSNTDEVN